MRLCAISLLLCVCECSYSALLVTPWLRGMAFYCHSFASFTWVRVASSTHAQSRGTRTLVRCDTSNSFFPSFLLSFFPFFLPQSIVLSSFGIIYLHATRPVILQSIDSILYFIFYEKIPRRELASCNGPWPGLCSWLLARTLHCVSLAVQARTPFFPVNSGVHPS